MKNTLTHIDEEGNLKMVNVSPKGNTNRKATASATVILKSETLQLILDSNNPKGDVFSAAKLAGIMAAKRTAELVPLCHPIALTDIQVNLTHNSSLEAITITATCETTGKTGVEMEALTAVSVAALTVYDMCKATDRGIVISDIHLLKKSGGQSGPYSAEP